MRRGLMRWLAVALCSLALGYGAATHELHAAAPTTQVASDPGTGSGGGG